MHAMNNQLNKPLNKHQGLTMVEILVTMFILSIGLLGMAGIQVKGIRGASSSQYRSQATILMQGMAERIHANPSGANNPPADDNIKYSKVSFTSTGAFCNTAPTTMCSDRRSDGGTFSAAQACDTDVLMATYDIYVWLCGNTSSDGIANQLPNGNANITCVDIDTTDGDGCSPGSALTIQVGWVESKIADSDAGAKSINVVVLP